MPRSASDLTVLQLNAGITANTLYRGKPTSHCMILARFFIHRQVLLNRRQMPEIGGKLVLVHVSDKSRSMNYQRCDLRESLMRRRRPWNIWHDKYLELSRFTILLCEWVLTEKYISDDLQPTRERDTGQRGSSGRTLFYFFYKQRAYIFALEYTEQVGYMKMKKGLRFSCK